MESRLKSWKTFLGQIYSPHSVRLEIKTDTGFPQGSRLRRPAMPLALRMVQLRIA